jgi:hypothetical protein
MLRMRLPDAWVWGMALLEDPKPGLQHGVRRERGGVGLHTIKRENLTHGPKACAGAGKPLPHIPISGLGKGLIKTSHRLHERTAHYAGVHRKGGAARPDSKHVAGWGPVVIDHVRAIGSHPSRAAVHGIQLRMVGELLGEAFQVHWRDPVIGIEKQEPVILCLCYARVPGSGFSAVGLPKQTDARITRPVVHYNGFPGRGGLCPH